MVEEPSRQLGHLGRGVGVLVVVHEDGEELGHLLLDLVDENAEEALGTRAGSGIPGVRLQGALAELGEGFDDAGRQVFDEGPGIGIRGVQPVPGGRHLGVVEEIQEERGLPVPRRGRDQDELLGQVLVEEVHEAGPPQQADPPLGRDDLGTDDPFKRRQH